jgi:hypothetical protein
MHIAKTAISVALAAIVGGGVLLISPTAQAEQPAGIAGAGTLTRAANVDFQITIPRFLRFRVGATGTTVNRIDFAPTADEVGTGVSNPAVLGGDAGVGQVNVQVRSNAGQIGIVATNAGAAGINDGGINVISYAEITTTSSAGVIPAPVLSNAASAAANVTLNSGGVTNRDAVWTYAYANTTIPEAGTYGGTNTRNGRVTYTASSP